MIFKITRSILFIASPFDARARRIFKIQQISNGQIPYLDTSTIRKAIRKCGNTYSSELRELKQKFQPSCVKDRTYLTIRPVQHRQLPIFLPRMHLSRNSKDKEQYY